MLPQIDNQASQLFLTQLNLNQARGLDQGGVMFRTTAGIADGHTVAGPDVPTGGSIMFTGPRADAQALMLAQALVAALAAVTGNSAAPAILQVVQASLAVPPTIRVSYVSGLPAQWPASGSQALTPGSATQLAYAALASYLVGKGA